MADINPDLKPILEMFAAQLKHPNVSSVLKDWKSTISKGILHFGRKEPLDKDIDFNVLIYTDLNPTAAKSGKRITLEPTLEIVGVVSNRKLAHEKFRYLRNEMVIVRASGRWDYYKNEGPLDLKMGSEVTVRLSNDTGPANRAATAEVLKLVGKLCFSWVVVNKMTSGAN